MANTLSCLLFSVLNIPLLPKTNILTSPYKGHTDQVFPGLFPSFLTFHPFFSSTLFCCINALHGGGFAALFGLNFCTVFCCLFSGPIPSPVSISYCTPFIVALDVRKRAAEQMCQSGAERQGWEIGGKKEQT